MQSLTVNQENFASVRWEDDYFKYCTFADISTEGGHVTSDFANCEFEGIDWYWGMFNIVNFVGCKFVNCVFMGTSFPDCKFIECEFNSCHFIKDNLGGDCDFDGSMAYNCKVLNTVGLDVQGIV